MKAFTISQAVLSTFLWSATTRALDDGLARTPPMGWNTWNYFGCDISEETILTAAHSIIDHGLKDLGYEYVVVDDCWHDKERDPSTGAPRANPDRFPNGIKHLSDAIHNLGLKIGIYSSAGTMTCGRQFGSLGYEEIDAKTYAEWEIDYLKYDNCYNEGRAGYNLISYDRYANMSRALQATGRPIVYAMCNWGEDGTWNWAPTIAHSWRMSGDITDHFDSFDERCPCESMLDCKLPGFHCSVTRIIDFAAPLGQKAGPGQWNDLDMLEVGNGGMTKNEYITHFSIWAIVKSPLILGNKLNQMDQETLDIISNKAIIAVNQDAWGSPASRRWKRPNPVGGDLQLWVGPLSDGTTVIAVLNTSPHDVTLDLHLDEVFIDDRNAAKDTYQLFDLWARDEETNEYGALFATSRNGVVSGIQIAFHLTRVFKAVRVDDRNTRYRENFGGEL